MIKRRRFSLTTRYVVVVGVLLLTANIILGLVTVRQSKDMMHTMINKNMLDIANSAAGLLDGDVMAALTEEDVGTPLYEEILKKLAVFQNKVDIEFIYAVRQTGPDSYVFTADPDPVDPGAFGEEIVVTDALVQAAKGIPTVDAAPMADRWGNFYSAYSPIFDSSGRVAGVVGVDFSSEWFEAQVRSHTYSIGIISVLTVAAAAFVMLLITGKLRRKFLDLESGLSHLAENVDALTKEIASNPGFKGSVDAAPAAPQRPDGEPSDEMEALGVKIDSVQHELERYLSYLHSQAYTDSLTHVGNTNAYQEELRVLKPKIERGEASFFAVVFDIDNLKLANDEFGHACGDRIIRGAAAAISAAFGTDRTFRIGGDEFIAIPLDLSEAEVEVKLRDIERAVAAFNAAPDHPEVPLTVSMGAAAFRPGVDRSFREVFVRADESMYAVKGEHHRRSCKMSAVKTM